MPAGGLLVKELPSGSSVIPGRVSVGGASYDMVKTKTYTVTGKSGAKYTFGVYGYPGEWNEVAGVYLITKRVVTGSSGSHSQIYVGETDNLKERHSGHHKESCFKRHGANCLCFLPETSGQRRLAIEKDILDGGTWPCND